MSDRILADSLLRNYADYDSQVIELVQALELAEIGSKTWREWFSALYISRYTFIPFCERYKEHLRELRAESERLQREYYLTNRKRSHHVYFSYRNKQDLFYRSDEGLFGTMR